MTMHGGGKYALPVCLLIGSGWDETVAPAAQIYYVIVTLPPLMRGDACESLNDTDNVTCSQPLRGLGTQQKYSMYGTAQSLQCS